MVNKQLSKSSKFELQTKVNGLFEKLSSRNDANSIRLSGMTIVAELTNQREREGELFSRQLYEIDLFEMEPSCFSSGVYTLMIYSETEEGS